jgi:diguanylate cyclase (GGDEF)-like protein
MTTLRKGKTFKFKSIAFFVSLILIIFYDYFPQRSIDLHPKLTKYIDESIDSTEGGKSELIWLDKKNLHWVCELRDGVLYPYCGISVAWSSQPFERLDFSSYSALQVDLEYNGQAKYIRVFLRNYYPLPNMQDAIGKAKFNSISKDAKEFKGVAYIPFDELRVADWWIDNNQIPPEDIKPELDEVIAVGLDIPHPNVLGRHEFKLHSLKVVGEIFSKESLYLGIISFWAFFLLGDMLIAHIKMRSQLQRDGQQLKELTVKSAIYQDKAEHDKLTGILNREGLNRMVDDLHSTQLLQQYTLLVLDLDFFKQVNDEHGHAIGDNVLRETASVLKSCMRSYDIISRWGGEEFVILFHCVDTDNLLPFAEKVRSSIESTSFSGGKLGTITVSIGATNLIKSEAFEHAFVRADKALYEAKENGRNSTVVILE